MAAENIDYNKVVDISKKLDRNRTKRQQESLFRRLGEDQIQQLEGILESVYDSHHKSTYCEQCENKKTLVELEKDQKVIIMLTKKSLVGYAVYFVVAFAFFVFSITCFMLWRVLNVPFQNPEKLFMWTLMGLGWTITAISGLWSIGRGDRGVL